MAYQEVQGNLWRFVVSLQTNGSRYRLFYFDGMVPKVFTGPDKTFDFDGKKPS